MNEFMIVAGGMGSVVFFILTVLAWMGRSKNSRKFFVLFLLFFLLFIFGFGNMEVEGLQGVE